MRTLDDVLFESKTVVDPLFLKPDIQGAELECLRGGGATLLKTEVVRLALLNYNEGAPQAAEVIAFVDTKGFALIDIAGFVRPDGINLVQIDIIFARKTSPLRTNCFSFLHLTMFFFNEFDTKSGGPKNRRMAVTMNLASSFYAC